MVIVYLLQVIWEIEGRSDGAQTSDSKESIRIHCEVIWKCEEIERIAER